MKQMFNGYTWINGTRFYTHTVIADTVNPIRRIAVTHMFDRDGTIWNAVERAYDNCEVKTILSEQKQLVRQNVGV